MSSLVDGSLVRQEIGPAGTPRYLMLETVREFGLEQLVASGGEPAARRVHADHALALAEEAAPHLLLPGQEPWLERLAADHGNLRAAFSWLMQTGEAEETLRLACALDRFWFVRGFFREGLDGLERALGLPGDAPVLLRATAQSAAGWMAVYAGDLSRAEALIATSLATWRELGDMEQVAINLIRLGVACTAQERYAESAAWHEEAIVVYQELGDAAPTGETFASITLNNLGDVEFARGEYDRSAARYTEALARHRQLGFAWGIGFSLTGLGNLARVRGDLTEAVGRYRESLDQWRSHRDPWGGIQALIGLADIALAWGQPERAARLISAVAAHFEVIGRASSRLVHRDEARTRVAIQAALNADAFATAWDEGRVLSYGTAVDEALRVEPPPPVPAEPTGQAATHGLTPRELEVLNHLAEGHSNREIAAALSVSPRTIDNHVSNLAAKLGVRSGRAALAAARRRGIV